MNWEEFQEWCDTAPLWELRNLAFDMWGGDFRYYDNHQRDEGFYDNWRDYDRRYRHLLKTIKRREEELPKNTDSWLEQFTDKEKHDEFWDCVKKQTFRNDREALKKWCVENNIFKNPDKINWG